METNVHLDLVAPEIVWMVSNDEPRCRSGGIMLMILTPWELEGVEPWGWGTDERGICHAALWPNVPVVKSHSHAIMFPYCYVSIPI